MRHLALVGLGTALLALSACGGSSGSGTSSTSPTPPPEPPTATIFVAGVVDGNGSGFTLNGRVLDLQGARLTLNGQTADLSSLKAGMPITGTALPQVGTWKLEEAETHSEIEGPLESVDHDTLRILGQPVRVTLRTRLAEDRGSGSEGELQIEDLHAGDDLRVFGVKGGGPLEATRVERRHVPAGETRISARGPVQGLDSSAFTFTLNGSRVEFGRAQVVGLLVEGAQVEVQGSLAGGAIAAARVVVEDGQPDPARPEVEVRGMMSGLDPAGKTFRLLAFTIDFSTASVTGTLAEGRWVQVHATQLAGQPAGRLSASRVKVEDDALPAVGEALLGVVDTLDPVNRTLGVGGSFFWMDDQTDLRLKGQPAPAGSLQVGSRVEIHFDAAKKNTSGFAYAFRVQIQASPEPAGPEGQAEGSISGFDSGSMQFSLGGLVVKTSAATVYHQKGGADLTAAVFWGSNRNGAKAEAVGTRSGSTLSASRIELK